MSDWLQLTFSVEQGLAEILADELTACGALSVTFQDAADEPVYEPALNTTPLWAHTKVIGLFEENFNTTELLTHLQVFFPTVSAYVLEKIPDQEWSRVWMDNFHPMRFGQRVWICPTWHAPPQPDAVNILLDPGLAFGTGTHATTALCLTWLDQADDLTDKTVLDFGCGSGILAIAAAKLGANQVWAVDNDPQALFATRENAQQNNVLEQLQLYLPENCPALQVDVLLANILATPLIELAPHLIAQVKPSGLIVLSGILNTQVESVSSAYASACEILEVAVQEDWVRIVARRW
jgi:ribosomal protein L11 methyltransferase